MHAGMAESVFPTFPSQVNRVSLAILNKDRPGVIILYLHWETMIYHKS